MKHGLIILTLIALFAGMHALTLDETLEYMNAGSLEYSKIRADRNINTKAIIKPIAYYLPQLSYYVNIDSTTATNYSQGFSISQQIFNVPYLLNIASGKEYADMGNMQYLYAKKQLIDNVITQFFDLMAKQQSIDTDSSLLFVEQDNVRKAQLLAEKGIISQTEYLQLKANLAGIQVRYISSKNALTESRIRFTQLTGIEEPGILEAASVIPQMDASRVNADEYMQNVPEYIIAAKQYYIARNSEASSYSQFLPTASFSMSAGFSDSVFNFTPSPFDSHYTFSTGLRINFPVFTGFSRVASVLESGAQRKQAEVNFLMTKQNIKSAMDSFKDRAEIAALSVSAADDAFKANEMLYKKSKELFNNGEISASEYIQAQKSYTDALSAKYSAYSELYKVYYEYLYYLRIQ